MKFGIGQSVTRGEDIRHLKGAAAFLDDIAMEDVLRAYILRSPVAHGRITSCDVSDARDMPGIALIWTHEDIAGRLTPIGDLLGLTQSDGTPFLNAPMPHLADDTVRFVGQPVALIVASTVEAARDAAEAIVLEIDDLPVIVDPLAAQSARALHPTVPENRYYTWSVGDQAAAEAAFAKADHVTRVDVVNQRLVVNSMEPRAILVRHGDTGWEAWIGNQGVHAARNALARDLGVEADDIRVHAPDIGGGFGMKLMNHPEYGLCALAAKTLGQPIKWVGDRSESFLSDVQARDLRTTAEGAFARDGRLLGMRWQSISNVGAYPSGYGMGVHTNFSGNLIGGVYDVQDAFHEVRGVATNTTPTDAYRGAGRPEVLHVMERLMSTAAAELGLDQVEIRQKNLIRPEQIPYKTVGGITFDALDAHGTLAIAVDKADLAAAPDRAADAAARGALHGTGVAYYFERTGGGPVENATVSLTETGEVEIMVGTQSTGQGHATAWAQIVHEKLGLPLDRIRLLAGDSAALVAGGGTGGSRSAIQASRVLLAASDDLIEQALGEAEEMLEVGRADLTYDPDTARISVAGTDRHVTLDQVREKAGVLTGSGSVNSTITTTPNGAHIAEVEVDRDTGKVTLTRYTVADDFGNVINPLLVEGQVMGGVVQGIGQILTEAFVLDAETGQPLSGSFMDYAMPRADDVPMIDVTLNAVPTPSNPLGIKGCGEAGSVAALGAVSNAVMDALRKAGIERLDPPYTPARVWAALNTG
ncbi:carbon-monoxide dehydrogenase large subunit [Rubricella aquisinus]|uniref:Carbon-monoxide dehydrogenase large subunit n=1 Tax=Rubricella aquisinus TaxID=2028108 RepID=A0A840X4M6_9RHOB|nr:xanthine dehydrogenase family protein molybdopterin-binding subunit [Rubricella aquisinus]MBB5516756.1 carbon-monoxide dehydrogenase large subunit [Rubricella aquisinus]